MIETFNVTITPLQRERTVRVYLPPSYHSSDKSYPVLYMHDGQNLFFDEEAGYGMAWKMGEFLDSSSYELIVVGIDCNTENEGNKRLDEYGPWENKDIGKLMRNLDETFGGEGKQYVEYIVNELKPFIDDNYRTIPNDTAMAGSSMGGLISTYAAFQYPNVFNRIASLSSAYWFNQKEIEELVAQSEPTVIQKFYLDVGTQEASGDVDAAMYVDSSERLYKLIKGKVIECKFEIIEGAEHNEIAWNKRLPEIFAFLYE
ncbi:alpha/beta hydrolase [Priestia koreensis]|uniref:alpha/beta hydrolase n=1 Tax=Priestia koreensis TaxID=284581 RepID=UPI00345779D3